MFGLIRILNEATKKTKIISKQVIDDELSAFKKMGDIDKNELAPVDKEKHSLQSASREETRKAISTVKPSREMLNKLQNMKLSLRDKERTEIGDEPTPRKPSTLPTIINRAILAAGELQPSWHAVKNLPGYLAEPIRAIGRQVFKPFTKTRIEDIGVLANLGGEGPNTSQEINAVAGYLQKHGTRATEAELFFHEQIPDYNASIKIYRSKDMTFMLVKDFAGNYIYTWPTEDEYRTKSITKDKRKELK